MRTYTTGQRANIVLFIRWRMQEVFVKTDKKTERLCDEKEKISANPGSWSEAL